MRVDTIHKQWPQLCRGHLLNSSLGFQSAQVTFGSLHCYAIRKRSIAQNCFSNTVVCFHSNQQYFLQPHKYLILQGILMFTWLMNLKWHLCFMLHAHIFAGEVRYPFIHTHYSIYKFLLQFSTIRHYLIAVLNVIVMNILNETPEITCKTNVCV